MKNPATHIYRDEFNAFTKRLFKRLCHGETVRVELRNGNQVELEWFVEPDYDDGVGYFRSRNHNHYWIWYNDGTSIHSDTLDMMEDC